MAKITTRGMGNTTPPKWRAISRSLRAFFTGLITLLVAVDWLPGNTVKVIVLILGIALLLLQSIDHLLGLPPEEVINQQMGKIEKEQTEKEQAAVEAANR